MSKASRTRQSAVKASSTGTGSGNIAIAVAAVAILILGIWAYTPALNGVYLFDDMTLPFAVPGGADIPWTSYLRGVRPLLYVIFWLEARTWSSPFGYHVVNLALHLVNSVLVGWIVLWFLRRIDVESRARGWLALFGGSLFLLHPIHTEAVAYIASLSEVLSVFFLLSAYALYLANRDEGIGFLSAILILALFGAGVASKEHIIVLPALLLITEFFWEPKGVWTGVRRNLIIYLFFPIAGAAAAAVLWRVLRGATSAGFGLQDFTWYQYLLTQCKVLWIYLRIWILPFGQNIDHGYPAVKGFDVLSVVGGILLVAGIAASFVYRKRFPLLSFGFLIFLLLISPTSSFVPIQDTLVERRVYLPGLGLVLMTLEGVRRWKASKEVWMTGLAGILAICAFLTHNRAYAYGSPVAMWQDVLAGSPHNARAHFQLAYAYYETGQCEAAVRQYDRVAQLQKPDYRLLIDWALALDCNQQAGPAKEKARRALEIENNAHGWAVLGMFHAKANEDNQAMEALAKAEGIDPNFDATYVYRGNIHFNRQRFAEAAAEYQKALTRNPRNVDAIKGLNLANGAQRQRPAR